MKIYKIICCCLFISLLACKDDEKVSPVNTTGSLNIKFDHVAGNSDLKLNTEKYINANGDTFSVSLFKYYVSNIKLRRKSDQKWVTLPASNQLIEEDVKDNFTLFNITAAHYDMLEFKVGLDSATNFGTNFTEDLNKSKGMYWEWNPQYVFLKLEGKRYYNATNGALVFHIADNSNLKTIQLPLSESIAVEKTLELQIKADVLKMFESPNQTDFSKVNNVMMGAEVAKIAQNYANMFTLVKEELK
jgi:hypothetical protein